MVRPVPGHGAAVRARRGAAQGSRALRQGEYRRGVGIAARIGIRAIPTLVLFKAGAEVKRVSGVLDARSLVQWIETEGATASEGRALPRGGAARRRLRSESRPPCGQRSDAGNRGGRGARRRAHLQRRSGGRGGAPVDRVRADPGRIVELRFDVGDYVKKGEVIVRIDERAAAQALAASEAQVRRPRRRCATRARSTSARASSSRRSSSARRRSTAPRPNTRRRRSA